MTLDEVVKEAAKILRDFPEISYKRAIEIAKKFYEEEKTPRIAVQKGQRKIIFK